MFQQSTFLLSGQVRLVAHEWSPDCNNSAPSFLSLFSSLSRVTIIQNWLCYVLLNYFYWINPHRTVQASQASARLCRMEKVYQTQYVHRVYPFPQQVAMTKRWQLYLTIGSDNNMDFCTLTDPQCFLYGLSRPFTMLDWVVIQGNLLFS